MIPTSVSAEGLSKTDFQKESFAKTIDFFDFARAWASSNGLPTPQNYWHANVYVTYVNKLGLQMLYAGLSNISLANQVYLTVPMQNLLLRYKTQQSKQETLIGSSFLMVMGFNDTAESIYENSPDQNDTLWASFSFGLNLRQLFPNATFPSLNSRCEIFPLTHSEDGLTWKWGMKYTNLTAFWVTTYITNQKETETTKPWGLATYDELTFNYTLSIDPETGKATIWQDHVIGRMRDLWTFYGWFLIWPLYNHYNSSGCYRYGTKVSDETIYNFLHKHAVKISIVNFQTSIMLERNTYCTTANGQNVTDNEVPVGGSTISTYSEDGEKIYEDTFDTKQSYNLFNYTEDPTESTSQPYDAIPRTTLIEGYARNRVLFQSHGIFAKYLPLILVHMYPQLYQAAKERIANMTRADYIYTISYPNYSGFRIEHDPIHTAYFTPTATVTAPNLGGFLVLIALGGIIVVVIAAMVGRRNRGKQSLTYETQLITFPYSVNFDLISEFAWTQL